MIVATILCLGTAWAQAPQPYAGLQKRPIKALSAEQVADLEAGRGMGLALSAELNGYPGPAHVLENAEALGLSPQQRERTLALFAAMQSEAIPIGQRLIAEEAALDRAFADRTITPQQLTQATASIGQVQAALRAAHLRYHLMQAELLSPEQMQRYAQLRGYADAGQGPAGHRHPGKMHTPQ
jgi:hypothetical protein